MFLARFLVVFLLFLLQVGFKVMIFGCYLYLVGVEISPSADKLCLGTLVTWTCTNELLKLEGKEVGWNDPEVYGKPFLLDLAVYCGIWMGTMKYLLAALALSPCYLNPLLVLTSQNLVSTESDQ